MRYLSPIPLPKTIEIIKTFSTSCHTPKDLAESFLTNKQHLLSFFSKSAYAMAACVKICLKLTNKDKINVWLPAYFCNMSLNPLRQLNVELCFYPITDDFNPNYEFCRQQSKVNKPDLFLLVHYFGSCADVKKANEFCKTTNCFLIEDAAHVFKPINDMGKYSDFIFFSPHKHLPIPDLSLLYANKKRICNKGIAENELQEVFSKYTINKSPNIVLTLKWLLKHFLKKIGVRSKSKRKQFQQASNFSNFQDYPYNPSTYSIKYLSYITEHLFIHSQSRKNHAILWQYLISKTFGDLKPLNLWNNSETPYLQPFQAENLEVASTHYQEMLNNMLPVSSWPDLPPEVQNKPELYKQTHEFRNSLLFLPLHQNLSANKINNSISTDKNLEHNNDTITIHWLKNEEKESWDHYFNQIPNSNLMQAYDYGEAKKMENWHPIRAIIKLNGEKIAIVQVLIKKVAGIIKIYRINRGPLFIKSVPPTVKNSVYNKLSELTSIYKCQFLFIAPELLYSGENLSLVLNNKFHIRQTLPKQSIWVDLTLSEEALRGALNGKWRNQLKKSEKNQLIVECDCNDDLFEWIKKRFQEDSQAKQYTSIPITTLTKLFKLSQNDKNLLILRALHDNTPVAGIIVQIHGQSATYLIGWNGDKGRKMYANNYLLWNAILTLKERNIHSFDLGGINQEKTPAITKFKRGINPKTYTLVGEFFNCHL